MQNFQDQLTSRFLAIAFAFCFAATSAHAQSPVPLVNEPLVPTTVAPHGPGFTLTVNGSGFAQNSVVMWNGSPRDTSLISSSQLKATISATDIAKAGTASVTVVSNGAASNVVFFSVTTPLSPVLLTPGISFNITGGIPIGIVAADFNSDGKMDLAVANQNFGFLSVLLGNGNGTFQTEKITSGVYAAEALAVGDFNGDGKLDLAVTNCGIDNTCGDGNDQVAILLGDGDGTFQPPINFPTGTSANLLAVADLNGDGKLDLIVANGFSTIGVMMGNGDGTFQPHVDYNTGDGPFSIVVGDFNRDGVLDLAVSNYCGQSSNCEGLGSVSVLLGNGDGTFQPQVQYLTANGPGGMVAADFNGDGILDLAVAATSFFAPPSSTQVLLGNGDGTFQSPASYAVGLDPFGFMTGDVTGDGILDLVATTENGGGGINAIDVYAGNGDGTFQSAVVYPTSIQPTRAAIADFNGDGKLDFAVAGYEGNNVYLQTTIATTPSTLTFATQPVGTASALQYITLTNLGTTSVSISRVSTTGTDSSQFFSQSNCGSSLHAGASCVVGVSFRPRSRGPQSATLTIQDSAPGPQLIALSGTGSLLSFSPSALNFGNQTVGTTSPPQNITVANVGGATIAFGRITIVGNGTREFTQKNNCVAGLTPGSSCTVSVTFTPNSTGVQNAVLFVYDNAGGSPQTITLAGTGT